MEGLAGQYGSTKPDKGSSYIEETKNERRSRIEYESFGYARRGEPTKQPLEVLDNHPLFSEFSMRDSSRKKKLDPTKDEIVFYPLTSYTTTVDNRPVVAVCGVTHHDGQPIYVEITDFKPYLLIGIPTEWTLQVGEARLERFAREFHRFIASAVEAHITTNKKLADQYGVLGVQRNQPVIHSIPHGAPVVEEVEDMIGYRPESVKAIKIETTDPNIVPIVRELCYHPFGVRMDACAFCYEKALRASIARGSFNIPHSHDTRELLRHSPDCRCLVHLSCSKKYGKRLRAGEFIENCWFSKCPCCSALFPEERLYPQDTTPNLVRDPRAEIYGPNEEYQYQPWILEFMKHMFHDSIDRIILPPPTPTGLEDMVITFEMKKNGQPPPPASFTPYSADTRFHSRLMMDQGIGFTWLSAKPRHWKNLTGEPKSIATHEVTVQYRHLHTCPKDEQPEIVVISWDLEMETMRKFPKFGTNAILQSPIKLYNTKTQQSKHVLFAIGDLPATIDGCPVFSEGYMEGDEESKLQAERTMLRNICLFFDVVRPNVVITYNGNAFDGPYFVRRAKHLGVLEARSLLGWIRGSAGDTRWRSDLKRGREIVRYTCKGIFYFDLLYWVKDSYNGNEWTSFTLNVAAKNILKRQKIDLKADETSKYQRTYDGRCELARYAIRDVDLPLDIVLVKNILEFLLLLSREFGVSPQEIVETGNKYIMGTALLRYAQLIYRPSQPRRLMPVMPTNRKPKKYHKDKPPKFPGAKVITPARGFYSNVATLDFNALYPSLMREHNFCPSAFVWPQVLEMYPNDIKRSDCYQRGYYEYDDATNVRTEHPTKQGPLFTLNDFKVGFITCYQEYLGNLRNAIRGRAKPLDQEKTIIEQRLKVIEGASEHREEMSQLKQRLAIIKRMKDTIDTEQSVCKVAMNSIYGIMTFYLKIVAESITLMGRDALMNAKKMAEEIYTRKNGYAGDLVVIYGDTDSIMVVLTNCLYEVSRDYILALMNDLSRRIREKYRVLNMAPEKVYVRMLLSGRKNYGAIMMMLSGEIKYDYKGYKFKKKDSTAMQQQLCKKILDIAITQGRLDLAIEKVQEQLCRIHKREATIMELARSGSFTKDITVVTKMKNAARTAAINHFNRSGQTISTIERVMYVICDFGPESKLQATDRAETALYAEMEGLPYDVEYYKSDLIKVVSPLLIEFFDSGIDQQVNIHVNKRKALTIKKLQNVLLDHPVLRQTLVIADRSQTKSKTGLENFVKGTDHGFRRVCQRCNRLFGKRPLLESDEPRKRQRVHTEVTYDYNPHGEGRKLDPLQLYDRPTREFIEFFYQTQDETSCVATTVQSSGTYGTFSAEHLAPFFRSNYQPLFCNSCFAATYIETSAAHGKQVFEDLASAVQQWGHCRKECVEGLTNGDAIRACENSDCTEWDKRRTKAKTCYNTRDTANRKFYVW